MKVKWGRANRGEDRDTAVRVHRDHKLLQRTASRAVSALAIFNAARDVRRLFTLESDSAAGHSCITSLFSSPPYRLEKRP